MFMIRIITLHSSLFTHVHVNLPCINRSVQHKISFCLCLILICTSSKIHKNLRAQITSPHKRLSHQNIHDVSPKSNTVPSAKVKNAWSYISTPTYHLHGTEKDTSTFSDSFISPIFQCSSQPSFIVPWSTTQTLNFHINHLAYSLSDGNSVNSLLASIMFGILQAKLNILGYAV